MGELQPGFRFYPTEEELITFYLRNRLDGKRQDLHRVVPIVNIYEREPWHLSEQSGELCRGDTEQWFFFMPRQDREARGGRPRRTTASGYWKATGSPSYVYSSNNRVIGMKKTMVFYEGKVPHGRKTKWKMNEYKAIEEVADSPSTVIPVLRHEFSLCRIYVTSGCTRAFDRRPLEAVMRRTQHHGDMAGTSAQGSRMVEDASTSETSNSGGGDYANLLNSTGSNTLGIAVSLEPPVWDWEQCNWP